ncbi:MAG: M48 family metallopeptidase [Cyanobacteria bacterium P01_A01_bin.135]
MSRLLFRLIIGAAFALLGLFSYFSSSSENPVTGETQRVKLTPEEEIALGRQARDELIGQAGGLYPDDVLQSYIDEVGAEVVQESAASQSPYPFEFHLLRDPETVNAFALPGGQIFITAALLDRLNNEAQLAGVLGHEVGHVVARHGAEQLAKRQLGAFLVNAIVLGTSDSPQDSRQAAILAQAVEQMVNLRYGRQDELESDRLGIDFMTEAGYNPQGLVELMRVLKEASGGAAPPEFFSTHPHPDSRIDKIEDIITERYPGGVPDPLEEGEADFQRTVDPRL